MIKVMCSHREDITEIVHMGRSNANHREPMAKWDCEGLQSWSDV